MLKKHKSKPANTGFIGRVIRSLFTIFVLTAFVILITLFVKALYSTPSNNYFSLLDPLLSKLPFKVDTKVAEDLVTHISEVTIATESTESTNDPDATYIAFLSDSHNNLDNLTRALDATKARGIKTAFFLGDYTDLGVIKDLEAAKQTMDASGIEYYSLPGDHDLWQSVGPDNFLQVFGKNYFVKTIDGFKFVGLDNSANYTVVPSSQLAWFKQNLSDADFVILSQPLYHPSFDVVMGVVNGEPVTNVKNQATELLGLIRNSNVKAIFAGDQHLSSQNIDPVKPSLHHIVVGALTRERNLQSPRFAIMSLHKNGDFDVEDVVLE